MDSTTPEPTPTKPKPFKLILALLTVLIVSGVVMIFFIAKEQTPQEPQSTEQNKLPPADVMSVSFLTTNESVPVGGEATKEIIVKGNNSTKKISGIQLKFVASGPVKIKDITLNRTDGGPISILKKEIATNEAGIVGVIIENEDKLPSEVNVTIQYTALSAGAVTFTLDPRSVQVTGPIASNSYEIAQVDSSNVVIK